MTSKKISQRPSPFSMRLTVEERAKLEELAGDTPLGTYARARLLEGHVRPRQNRGKRSVKDHEALARILGMLGQSRLTDNLSQLAEAAHIGALPVSPETEQEIKDACAHVRAMRDALMRALGLTGSAVS